MSQQPDNTTHDNYNNEKNFITDSVISTKRTLLDVIKGIFKSDKTIGELNGRWAAGFKICVLLLFMIIPSLFGWGIWVTNQITKTRYQSEIICVHQDRIITDHTNKIGEIEVVLSKHAQLLMRVPDIESRILRQEQRINQLDKNNSADHSKIMTILEFIKEQVE